MSTYVEGWVQAQHDSGVKEFPAECNQVADGKATEEILRPDVTGIFIPKEDLAGPVFHVNEAVVLDVSTSLDTISLGTCNFYANTVRFCMFCAVVLELGLLGVR